jgi:hypothetical protein
MTMCNKGLRHGTYFDIDFEKGIYKKVCYTNGKAIWEITIDRPLWYWECFISTIPNHNPKARPKNWHDSWKTKRFLCQ